MVGLALRIKQKPAYNDRFLSFVMLGPNVSESDMVTLQAQCSFTNLPWDVGGRLSTSSNRSEKEGGTKGIHGLWHWISWNDVSLKSFELV
jgi:hypothetical protein